MNKKRENEQRASKCVSKSRVFFVIKNDECFGLNFSAQFLIIFFFIFDWYALVYVILGGCFKLPAILLGDNSKHDDDENEFTTTTKSMRKNLEILSLHFFQDNFFSNWIFILLYFIYIYL